MLRAVALAALVVASYGTVIATGGWIWDDAEYVTRNMLLSPDRPDGLRRIWTDTSATPQYYPVVHTSFWLETRSFPSVTVVRSGREVTEPHPAGFHATNVLLMVATVLLFWRVLQRLAVPAAWFGAALAAVHPVNAESVAWVTERKNMLSGLFMMMTALLYLRFAGIGNRADQRERRWGFWFAALACWILGLLSKTVIAFVPAALLLLVWWRRPEHWRRHVLPLLPLFVLGVLAGLNTARIEAAQVAAGKDYFDLDAVERVLLAGRVVWTYFLHLVAPIEQVFFYPKWRPDPGAALQWVLLGAAIGLVLLLMRTTRRLGRGPLVAVLVFGGALVPVMGFFDVYPFRFSWVSDHFQYHASFAMLALFGAMASRVRLLRGRARAIIAAAVLSVLASLTAMRCLVYRDRETLWRDTIARNAQSWIAWANLGDLLRERGDFGEAMRCIRRALDLNGEPRIRGMLAAACLARFGRDKDPADLDAAIEAAERAVAEWPEFAKGHLLLARAYGVKGPQSRAKVIAHLEGLRDAVVTERMGAGLLESKLLSAELQHEMQRLYAAYAFVGRQRLQRGDAAGALDYFTRSAAPVGGTCARPWRDLYPWTEGSPWFELELLRIWMHAAAPDAALRDPELAGREISTLVAEYQGRLRTAGASRALVLSRGVEVLDLQAAVAASRSRFDEARRLADRVLATVRQASGAPPEWLRGIAARRAMYAAGRAFRLSGRVPLAPRR